MYEFALCEAPAFRNRRRHHLDLATHSDVVPRWEFDNETRQTMTTTTPGAQ